MIEFEGQQWEETGEERQVIPGEVFLAYNGLCAFRCSGVVFGELVRKILRPVSAPPQPPAHVPIMTLQECMEAEEPMRIAQPEDVTIEGGYHKLAHGVWVKHEAWGVRLVCVTPETEEPFQAAEQAGEPGLAVKELAESLSRALMESTEPIERSKVWRRIVEATLVNELRPLLEKARALLNTMEICHHCKAAVLMEETPVHCEDCYPDCEIHEEPDCQTIQSLHRSAKSELGRWEKLS